MALFGWFKGLNRRGQNGQSKALQSIDDRSWTRIFDWIPAAWQAHYPYDKEDSVLANPTVFACHTLIQGDIGKLRPIIQRQQGDIWVENDHRYSELLRRPNRYQNHIQFKQHWLNSKLNNGNTYVLKKRSPGNMEVVEELHILDSLKVTPLVADNGDVYYQLSNDKLPEIIEQAVVPASEIIHDRFNCLYHPLVGLSPLFAAGTSSTMGLKIINNSKDFFANGANPGGMLTAPGAISEETAKRLKEYWTEKFKGSNSGNIAVAGDGLEYKPMRMNSTDAQLLEQLKWSDEKICSCFHVPAYKVGVGAAPTYNNIEALTQDYYSQCLQILIESMESALDIGLGIESGYRVQIDLDGLFRMDQTTLVKTLTEGGKGGLISPDEGRKKLNLPPVPGGKYPYLQEQNYSLEALAQRDSENPLGKPDPAPTMPAANDDEEDITEEEMQLAANTLAFKLSMKKAFRKSRPSP